MLTQHTHTVDLTTLKTKPGEVLDKVKNTPITVERYGKPVAIIITPEQYERFENLEDAYWLKVIEARRKEGGYLSADESLKAVQDLLTK